jgi:hypothetical protein
MTCPVVDLNHPAYHLGIASELASKPVIGDCAIGISKCEPARLASQCDARTFRTGDADVARCYAYRFGSAGMGQRCSRVGATVDNDKRPYNVASQLRVRGSPQYGLKAGHDVRSLVMGRNNDTDHLFLRSHRIGRRRSKHLSFASPRASGVPRFRFFVRRNESCTIFPAVIYRSHLSGGPAAICQSR